MNLDANTLADIALATIAGAGAAYLYVRVAIAKLEADAASIRSEIGILIQSREKRSEELNRRIDRLEKAMDENRKAGRAT